MTRRWAVVRTDTDPFRVISDGHTDREEAAREAERRAEQLPRGSYEPRAEAALRMDMAAGAAVRWSA